MARKPNFLFIITDQQRADHLGCYGNKIVKTDAIDSLASQGRRFENFFVANPICMPNRASIMTGRMPSLHGARHNGIALSRDHTTFVEILRAAGYRTTLTGKSHLQSFTGLPATNVFKAGEGLDAPPEPLRDANKNRRAGPDYDLENVLHWDRPMRQRLKSDFYGFEHFDIVADHADRACGDYLLWARSKRADYDTLVGPENALADNRINSPQAWRTAVPEELYSTTYIKECTLAAIEASAKEKDRPFFIQMSFPDPHHPFTPPGKYWDMYDPAKMPLSPSFGKGDLPPLKAMREAFEKGQDPRDNQNPFAVSEREAREITALTYGSITMIDDAIGDVLARLKALGLEQDTIVIFTSDHGEYMGDHGIMLKLLLHYRGLIRVPFIWSEPGGTAALDTSMGSSIDIASTILLRAGIQPFNGMQGRNLLGDPALAPDTILVEEDSQRPMVGFPKPQRVRTLVSERWRMSVRYGEDWGELYDLQNDPMEIENVWADPAFSAVKAQLFEKLALRLIEIQDRSPLPAYRA